MSDDSENIPLKEKKPSSDSSLDGVDNKACEIEDNIDSQQCDMNDEVVNHGSDSSSDVESKTVNHTPDEAEDGIVNKACDMATQTMEPEPAGI